MVVVEWKLEVPRRNEVHLATRLLRRIRLVVRRRRRDRRHAIHRDLLVSERRLVGEGGKVRRDVELAQRDGDLSDKRRYIKSKLLAPWAL